jgi:hypothetical protein
MDKKDAKMNKPPTKTGEQVPRQALPSLSVKELETRLQLLYPTLEKTFYAIYGFAQMAPRMEQQWHAVVGLETHFNKLWHELEATVDAVCTHATLSEYNEEQSGKLTAIVSEQMQLLQAFTSDDGVSSEWLAQRDAIVVQARKLMDDDEPPFRCNREK